MTIKEGIKQVGFPFNIPNVGRNDLPGFFKEMGYKKGVEIGVFKGEFTEEFAKSGLEIYGVDPWSLYKDYGNPRGKARMDEQFRMAYERLRPHKNAHLIRATSMQALDYFEDESIDFVYIDGNHQFAYVADDIYHWAIKVKGGGALTGHDYAHYKSSSICGGCHAKDVIEAYVKSYYLPGFHVLGCRNDKCKDHAVNGVEKRDQYRSWLLMKKHDTPQHIMKN